jgi:hypothetical protein
LFFGLAGAVRSTKPACAHAQPVAGPQARRSQRAALRPPLARASAACSAHAVHPQPALAALASAAQAESHIRSAPQLGVVYLALNVAQEHKLIEQHGKAAGLDVQVEFARLSGGSAVHDALQSGQIGIAAAGVLLMQEPFAAFDAPRRRSLQEALLALWRQVRSRLLFVTHWVEEALFFGSRIGVLAPHPGLLRAELNAQAAAWTVPAARPSRPRRSAAKACVGCAGAASRTAASSTPTAHTAGRTAERCG